MKILMAIMIPIVLIGGAVAFLWYSGKLPFIKKKAHAVAVVKTTTAKTADSTKVKADPVTPMPAMPKVKPTALSVIPDPQEEASLTRMAAVYDSMPTEDANRVFTKLPDPLVEKLLRRMDESKVAKLLALFPIDRAAKLTAKMAVK